jgi:uncharacterized membrane protein
MTHDSAATELLTTILEIVVPIVETCGVLVIVLEVFRTSVRYVLNFLGMRETEMVEMRLRLGQSLVMGLEFLVAADILKTSLSPTWNDVAFLAALIALRTVLNYLLERELQAIIKEEKLCSGEDL